MVNAPNPYIAMAHKFGLAKVPQTLEELMAALQQIMTPNEFELVKYMFMTPEQYQAANPFGSPDTPAGSGTAPAKDKAPALVTQGSPAVVTTPPGPTTTTGTPTPTSSTPEQNAAVAAAAAKNAADQAAVTAAVKAAQGIPRSNPSSTSTTGPVAAVPIPVAPGGGQFGGGGFLDVNGTPIKFEANANVPIYGSQARSTLGGMPGGKQFSAPISPVVMPTAPAPLPRSERE